jgi:hypothetical protein
MSELSNYIRFTSANPRFNFSFLYPSDWQLREVTGADYDEVFILGPRNKENTYSLALAIRVTLSREKGGRYGSLEELIADHLARCQRSTGFQEISRAYGYLADVEATEIEIGYTIPLPINTLNPQKTPIVERRIFLKEGEYFYEVIYRAVKENYYQYLEAFKDVVRTFEFRYATAQRVYRPLVMPAPAYAVHEHPTEYRADGRESQRTPPERNG